LFLKYPFYGSRQMARRLQRNGVCAGRHRVHRLMRLMGLEAVCQTPRTCAPHPEHLGLGPAASQKGMKVRFIAG